MRTIICCTLACGALCLSPVAAGAQDTTTVTTPERRAARDSVVHALAGIVVKADAARRASYAPRHSVAAMKTDTPLLDVPQAVTVVGGQLIADQAMQGMADVVRYVPGITMGQGEGHRDAPTIRGQSSTADFFVDGVRDDAQYLRDVYNVDRVEALKGANAMMFGRGGGGGVINRVTKEAGWAPVRTLSLEGGSWEHQRATLDAGKTIGRSAAGRVTALLQDSRGFRDHATNERRGINPTAALVLRGTVVRAGYEYFIDRRNVDRGVPSFRGRPSRADVTTFFGDPGLSRSRAAVQNASALVERGDADRLMVRNRTRWTRYDKFYQNVFPNSPVDTTGTRLTLAGYNNATDRDNLFNQTDVTWRVVTGAVTQTLLAGAEVGRQRTDNFRNTGYFDGGSATSMSADYAAPTVEANVAFRQSASDADGRADARVLAGYLQNQIALGRHVQAVAGVRWDQFDIDFTNRRDTSARTRIRDRRDRMVSPRAGLVLKPADRVSLYGTYSVAYLPSSGDQFSSLTATTVNLEPEEFRNHELGLKWDVRRDLAITGALYRLERAASAAPRVATIASTCPRVCTRSRSSSVASRGSMTSPPCSLNMAATDCSTCARSGRSGWPTGVT